MPIAAVCFDQGKYRDATGHRWYHYKTSMTDLQDGDKVIAKTMYGSQVCTFKRYVSPSMLDRVPSAELAHRAFDFEHELIGYYKPVIRSQWDTEVRIKKTIKAEEIKENPFNHKQYYKTKEATFMKTFMENTCSTANTSKDMLITMQIGAAIITSIKTGLRKSPMPDEVKELLKLEPWATVAIGFVFSTVVDMTMPDNVKLAKASEAVKTVAVARLSERFDIVATIVENIEQITDLTSAIQTTEEEEKVGPIE